MYFPYLRGKQNELLALRELLENNLLSEKIIPIIEPIKASPTLRILLTQFQDQNRSIAVIQNTELVNYQCFEDTDIAELKKQDFFIPAFLLDDRDEASIQALNNSSNQYKMGIINSRSEFSNPMLLKQPNVFSLIEIDNRAAVRSLKGDASRPIELHDQFTKLMRNSDYSRNEDELFSQEHLYYADDGYSGFSDFSVIGEDYSESGFAPYAIAVHLVYFDRTNSLRVHHFVSNSNDDISDPAGKLHEALGKLISWVSDPRKFDAARNSSSALDSLMNIFQNGSYPGLGVIKRLSIEHHLEIMGNFLDGR